MPKMHSLKQLGSFVLLLTMHYQQLHAQEKFTDSLTIYSDTLKEVVIAAFKTETATKDVVQQVFCIKQDMISLSNSANTASLLESSGHAFVQKSQSGGGSVVLRGFEANRIVLMIDGVRLNNLIYRSGHLQNIITVDNASLEKIELLNGASSTIYGSDALGGVVCLYTPKPRLSSSGKPKVNGNTFIRYGTASNEVTGHASLNIGLKKIAFLSTLTYSRFGDLRMGEIQNPIYNQEFGMRYFYADRINGRDSLISNQKPQKQKFSGYQQYDLLQKILFQQKKHLTHQFNFQFSNSNNIPRYDRLTNPKGDGLNYSEWYYGPQTRALVAYDFSGSPTNRIFHLMHAAVNYQYIAESRHSRGFGKDFLSHRYERVQVLGYNFDLNKQIRNHQLIFGVDGQFSTVKSSANKENINTGERSALDTRYPDGKNFMQLIAVYASHIGHLGKYTTMNTGVRIGFAGLNSSFSDTGFFHFPFSETSQKNVTASGNIGIVYNPQQWKISVLFSSGFRVPNIDDLAKVFESVPGRLLIPNPNLQPEKTITGEFGLTKQFGKYLKWENIFWATYFMDALQTGRFALNGSDSVMYEGNKSAVYANLNTGKAWILGYNTSILVNFCSFLDATFTLTYTKGKVLSDSVSTPLDHISPLYGKAGIIYHTKKTTVECYTLFNGWKKLKDYSNSGEDNLQYATADGTPAWFTFNLKASYQAHKYVTIQAGIENLMDFQYRTFSSGINAPGRNIYCSLRLSW